MMAQHTQGRLNYAYDGKDVAAGGVRYCWLIPEPNGSSMADDVGYRIAEPNARRLAACWNFCLGVDTAGLEAIQGGIHGLLVRGAEEQEALAADRTALGDINAAFIRLRDELEKANANLGYYQRALSSPEAPQYLVQDGGCVPTVQMERVAVLADDFKVARTLLSDAMETFDENPAQDHEIADRIRAFLKGGA
jgi:hypothetical protein